MKQPVERKLAAILAVDVVGYSGLMGADGDGTLARLKAHRARTDWSQDRRTSPAHCRRHLCIRERAGGPRRVSSISSLHKGTACAGAFG